MSDQFIEALNSRTDSLIAERVLRRMGSQSHLREALGRQDISVRFGGGKQFVTMGDHETVELPAEASTDEVAKALNLQKVDSAAQAIAQVPAKPPVVSEPLRRSITGIQPGSIKETIAAMKAERQQRRQQALAKLAAANSKYDKADDQIERFAEALDKEADDALHEFAEFTNGPEE